MNYVLNLENMDDIILDRNTDGYRVTSMDALDEISLV
jgi:hypothetical protein